MAYYGFSFYSLAWGQLVQLVVLLILRAIARPWAVFCRPVFSGWKDILHFGTFTTMIGLLGQINTQAVTTIIGRTLGFSNLGFYERANGTNNYVRDMTYSVMQVVYVGLSLVKDKPAEFAGLFIISIENMTGVFWPAYAFIMLLSGPIVSVLFGPAWAPAAPLLSIICGAGLFVSSCSVHARLLTSLGRVQSIFMIEAIGMAVRLPAVFFLARYGLQWTVIGVVAPYILTAVLYWREIRAHVVIRRALVIAALRRSFLVMLATISIPVLLMGTGFFDAYAPGFQLAISTVAAGVCWLIALYALRHPLRLELSGGIDHALTTLRRLRRANGRSELI
jgi:O-antigen/teichoic acid export membrane protein